MRKDRVVNLVVLLFLVFVLLDALLIALEIWGIRTPFVQMVEQRGRITIMGSDIIVFIFSVPIAIILEQLWEREKWAWFGEGKHPRKNVFAVFLVLYLILFFAILVGGFDLCRASCTTVHGCTVSYAPLHVDILYSCRQLIQPPAPS